MQTGCLLGASSNDLSPSFCFWVHVFPLGISSDHSILSGWEKTLLRRLAPEEHPPRGARRGEAERERSWEHMSSPVLGCQSDRQRLYSPIEYCSNRRHRNTLPGVVVGRSLCTLRSTNETNCVDPMLLRYSVLNDWRTVSHLRIREHYNNKSLV